MTNEKDDWRVARDQNNTPIMAFRMSEIIGVYSPSFSKVPNQCSIILKTGATFSIGTSVEQALQAIGVIEGQTQSLPETAS